MPDIESVSTEEKKSIIYKFKGAKLSYGGNILYCAMYRTLDENVDACRRALMILNDGFDIMAVDDGSQFSFDGGKIEAYTSRG